MAGTSSKPTLEQLLDLINQQIASNNQQYESIKAMVQENNSDNRKIILTLQGMVSEQAALINALKAQLEEEKKLNSAAMAALRLELLERLARPSTDMDIDPGDKVLHEDRLLAFVPEEHVANLRSIINKVVQDERPGADYAFSIAPRRPKQEARGGTAAAAATGASAQGGRRGDARPMRRLVDIGILPRDRRALATLGGVLNSKYNIAIKDALTRVGREMFQKRSATFTKLREDNLKPRWVRGVDIMIEKDGRRVPFEGPWVEAGPSGSDGGEGAAAAAGGGGTAAGGCNAGVR